jgi:hypothetical protein
MKLSLSEMTKIVEAICPDAAEDGKEGDWVSLKNTGVAFVIAHISQLSGAQVTLTIKQATDVAGTGVKNITNAVPIWANEDCAASDTLVRQPDAVNFTTKGTYPKCKIVVFQVDPETLDVANDFDCLEVVSGGGDSGTIVGAIYYLADYRYQQATPPTAIID